MAATAVTRTPTEVIERYCVRCHNERRLAGNLTLETFVVASAHERAQTAEQMILKLRAGMMPPPGARRPAGDTLRTLVEALEAVIDEAAIADPNPGVRRFQRLNRAEYERVIRDLLALDVAAGPLASSRHLFGQLRQLVRRTGALAHAARGVLEGGRGGQPYGRGHARRCRVLDKVHESDRGLATRVGPARRRPVRDTRRDRRHPRLPGGRLLRVLVRDTLWQGHVLRGCRSLHRRRGCCAVGPRAQRRQQRSDPNRAD